MVRSNFFLSFDPFFFLFLTFFKVNRGYDILVKLADAITAKNKYQYEELTSKFYTAIPHTFGRVRPPIIADLETVQQKKDMLAVLGESSLFLFFLFQFFVVFFPYFSFQYFFFIFFFLLCFLIYFLTKTGDIALAQELANKAEEAESQEITEVDHPLDANYKTLDCEIEPLAQDSDDYEVILNYLNNTMGDWRKLKVLDVFTSIFFLSFLLFFLFF